MNLINDDCLNAMANLPDNSVDTVITDPPSESRTGLKKGEDYGRC